MIFNTAPILATDDTPTLSPHFDGTLMVIRAQFTSARLTKNALNALYQRQVNVLGLILNCVDTEMPDYYYYRYPKYYAREVGRPAALTQPAARARAAFPTPCAARRCPPAGRGFGR